MERQFILTLLFGPKNTDILMFTGKSETIAANSMIELVSKFVILIAKLDKEFHEEDLNNLTRKKDMNNDIPF